MSDEIKQQHGNLMLVFKAVRQRERERELVWIGSWLQTT